MSLVDKERNDKMTTDLGQGQFTVRGWAQLGRHTQSLWVPVEVDFELSFCFEFTDQT